MHAFETQEAIEATGWDFSGPADILLVFPHLGIVPEVHVNAIGDEYSVTGVILRHPEADQATNKVLVHQHGRSRITAENAEQAFSTGHTPQTLWHVFLDDAVAHCAMVQANQFQGLANAVGFDVEGFIRNIGEAAYDDMLGTLHECDRHLTRMLVERRLDIVDVSTMDPDLISAIDSEELDAMVQTIAITRKVVAGTATDAEKELALGFLAKYGGRRS